MEWSFSGVGGEGNGSQCLMGAVTFLQDGKNFVNGGCNGWTLQIEVTLEHCRFELHGSTYIWIFSINIQWTPLMHGFRIHRFHQPLIEIFLCGWLNLWLWNHRSRGPTAPHRFIQRIEHPWIWVLIGWRAGPAINQLQILGGGLYHSLPDFLFIHLQVLVLEDVSSWFTVSFSLFLHMSQN